MIEKTVIFQLFTSLYKYDIVFYLKIGWFGFFFYLHSIYKL